MTRVRGTTNGLRVQRVVVRWRVGPAAARSVFGDPGRGPVEIEFRLSRDAGGGGANGDGRGSWTGEVVLGSDDSSRSIREPASIRVGVVAENGLVHIDADGFVHATIDVTGEAAALVYSRTPLLAELGLPGGRYEPAGVVLDVQHREGPSAVD